MKRDETRPTKSVSGFVVPVSPVQVKKNAANAKGGNQLDRVEAKLDYLISMVERGVSSGS